MFLLEVVIKLLPIFIVCKFCPLDQILGARCNPKYQSVVNKI